MPAGPAPTVDVGAVSEPMQDHVEPFLKSIFIKRNAAADFGERPCDRRLALFSKKTALRAGLAMKR
jgi:hypothetical protein